MILNPFPGLLDYAFFAPLMLRLFLGAVFLNFGLSKLSKEKFIKAEFFEKIGLRPGSRYVWVFGTLELVAGGALIVGLYTQIAALVAVLILCGTIYIKRKHPELLSSELKFYGGLLIMALSLLLTGAGAYSIDLPL